MTPEPFVTQELSGWGRTPVETCHVFRPERRSALGRVLASPAQPSYIPRGLGRSYGDAALNRNAGVISLERLSRMLSFDPQSGTLECESGTSFADIVATFLPRGYFLPVTPGTRFVTVGGAIAANVHGKNHHRDGALANFVERFTLLTPAGDILACSRTENADAFWATLGGMGLTGIVLTARLRLRPVETAFIVVDYRKTHDIEEALALFEDSDHRYESSVAWIDCLSRGKGLGRCIVMQGNHARAADVPTGIRNPLAPLGRRSLAVPWALPSWVLKPPAARAFNEAYYRRHSTVSGRLVDLERFFYPLDAVRHWNRLYGRAGFVQYQMVLPPSTARDGLVAVLEQLHRTHQPAFLAVLKRFGESDPGLLSFPMPGYTLALDMPYTPDLAGLAHRLDETVLTHGGRTYLAKDALLTPEHFAAMYPRAQEFCQVKERLDPGGRFASSLARRVGLCSG